MECTDWIPESSLADSEASGDSDEDSTAVAAAVSAGYHDDDAESCTGGSSGVAGSRETMEEPGWVSVRWWLVDCAPDYEAATEIDDTVARQGANGSVSATTTAAKGGELSVVDIESDRLFWEACLAHGYA